MYSLKVSVSVDCVDKAVPPGGVELRVPLAVAVAAIGTAEMLTSTGADGGAATIGSPADGATVPVIFEGCLSTWS